MFLDIIVIAILCIVFGGLSIPISFTVNSSPLIVWLGNALGSMVSAAVVIYIAERLTSEKFKHKVTRFRIGNKVVSIMDEGDKNQKVAKARVIINRRGIKVFALFCPIFPGALLSTVAVYGLNLDTKTYKRWLMAGIFLVSGLYVYSYWYLVIK